jgi:phosphatidate cytidylyltransferase
MQIWYLIGGILGILLGATFTGTILKMRISDEKMQTTLENVLARIKAWWIICGVFMVALLSGKIGILLLFALVSFFAFREFMTMTPTRNGDHKSLIVIFFVIIPFQYCLIGMRWYGLFSIMIPVYAFILVPILTAVAGDHHNYFGRTAKIQWGLMACVYCMSYAPALLVLDIPGYQGQNAKLLLCLVLIIEMNDVLQYLWGKWLGTRKILPTISPNKTWEGFIGGTITANLFGMGLWWVTPFRAIQAFMLSLIVTLAGFGGDMTMSAIKRDLGVKDYGALLPGHGGMMDRVDSLCFAAPIFFHITRYFFV